MYLKLRNCNFGTKNSPIWLVVPQVETSNLRKTDIQLKMKSIDDSSCHIHKRSKVNVADITISRSSGWFRCNKCQSFAEIYP